MAKVDKRRFDATLTKLLASPAVPMKKLGRKSKHKPAKIILPRESTQ
jgi:hypothetical protein